MRHAVVLASAMATMLATALAVSTVARSSPGPGLILAWNSDPGKMLSSLPRGQVRVVNTWVSGHVVQLHVASMRDFRSPLAATRLAITLPEMGIALAGCG